MGFRATPGVLIQEDFSAFDAPWRGELVRGGPTARAGEFALPEGPGLGVELDLGTCARHPYQRNSFPSLWDDRWIKEFTKARVDGA